MSAGSARLFVALELPPAAVTAVTEWQRERLRAIARLRLVPDSAMHVTLCFLGSRPATEIERIGDTCVTLAQGHPLELSLGQVLWLPSRRPNVVAVALEDHDAGLALLQSQLSRALQDGGWYEAERRPFLAHITLARVARGKRVRPVALPAPPPVRFVSTLLTLYRSRTGGSGARYERLASVRLGAPAAPPGARPSDAPALRDRP